MAGILCQGEGVIDPFAHSGPPKARSACVIVGAVPEEVAALHVSAELAIRANRLGTLVIGRLGSLPLDYSEHFDGPVYDVMFNPTTGWFCVTVFAAADPPVRFEPDTSGQMLGGYTRVPDILGATTRDGVLEALDIPRAFVDPAISPAE
jgi:hypothetical protein